MRKSRLTEEQMVKILGESERTSVADAAKKYARQRADAVLVA